MPKRYSIHPQARADIQGITRTISADNPAAAKKMKAAMMEACEKLGEHPQMGQERDDLTSKAVRFWPVHRSYMIIYNANTSPVQILRVYNNAQHIGSILPQ